MNRQREYYACDIEVTKSGLKLNYPRPLAAVLLNDFQDDLQRYSTQLAGAQADVNLLKAHIRKHQSKSQGTFHSGKVKHLSTSCSISEECPELKLPGAEEPVEVCSYTSLSELEEELALKRLERDKIFQKYKRMLHIREILGEYVSDRVLLSASTSARVTKRKVIRSKLHLSGKVKVENPLHKIYIGLVDVKQEKIKETKKLVEEKVRLVSVKEGIRAALQELQTAGSTYGIEFDQFGSLRSTDIMTRPQLPTNWRTLEEQIKQIIDDPEEPLAVAHSDGCEKILNECKLLLKFHNKYLESETDTDMRSGSPDTASLLGSIASPNGGQMNGDIYHRKHSDTSSEDFTDTSYDGSGSQTGNVYVPLQHMASNEPRQSTRSSLVEFEQLEDTSDDLVIIHDISPDYARRAVDKLRKQIKAHMESMSQKLHVQTDRGVSQQKVWACYERIFFTVVSDDLKKIYKLAYMDVLRGLEKEVPRLTPFSLAMDNSIVYPLFCDNSSVYSEQEAPAISDDNNSESVEDTVFGENFEESVPSLPKLTRLRSDSVLVKSVKRKNRETVILGKNETSTQPGLVQDPGENVSNLSQLAIDETEIRARDQEEVALQPDLDEFLEICSNQDGVYDCKPSFTESDQDIVPGTAGTLLEGYSGPHDESIERESSVSSNYNIDLAESIISGAASGQLKKEVTQTMPHSSLESSSDRQSLYGRSKYANVLDQINMDYARHVQKDIRICYPVSVNVAATGDRSTWPLAVVKHDSLEVGHDALISLSGEEDLTELKDLCQTLCRAKPSQVPSNVPLFRTESSLTTKTIKIKPEYKQKLQGVITLFEEMCHESTPTEKLKKAFLALKELGNQFGSFSNNPLDQGTFGASADELSDFLVVLLCNIDLKLLLQIYISAQMMRDLMAEYLETGPYGFSVMQLIIGLHFLQERIVMQRGLVLNHQQYSFM